MYRKAWLFGAPAPGVDRDLERLQGVLRDELSDDHRFQLAVSEVATAPALLDEVIPDVGKWVSAGNLGLLWIAGHGAVHREEHRLFTAEIDPDTDADSALRLSTFWKQLRAAVGESAPGAGLLFVVLDFCHSRDRDLPALPPHIVVLGASASDETARGNASDGGFLTSGLAQGLMGQQHRDGKVDFETLYRAVKTHKEEAQNGYQSPWWMHREHHEDVVLNQIHVARSAAVAPLLARAPSPSLWPWVQVQPDHLGDVSDDDSLLRYFDGMQPEWGIAVDPRVPMLPLGQIILRHLAEQHSPVSLDLVCTPTGEGKSTLLLQLAVRLAREPDTTVFLLNEGSTDFDVGALSSHLDQADRTVLVVDEAADFAGPLHRLCLSLRLRLRSRPPVQLLCASSLHRWRNLGADAYSFKVACRGGFRTHRHMGVDLDAARAIVQGWQSVGSSRTHPDLSSEELAELLLTKVRDARVEDHGLFGALLGLRFHKEQLRGHARELLRQLQEVDDVLPDALLRLALADVLELPGVDRRVLARVLEIPIARFGSQIEHGLSGEAALGSGGAGRGRLVRTRHPDIARALLAVRVDQGRQWSLEVMVAEMVRAAIELEKMAGDVEGHAQLVHVSLRVSSRLAQIIGADLAEHMALAAAEAAWQGRPRLDYLFEWARLLNWSGRQNRVRDLLSKQWPHLHELEDHADHARGVLMEWARGEAKDDRAELALALYIASLSDQIVDSDGEPTPILEDDLRRGLVNLLRLGGRVPQVRRLLEPLRSLEALQSELEVRGRRERWRPTTPPLDAAAAIEVLQAVYARLPLDTLPTPLAHLETLTFEDLAVAYQRDVEGRFGPLLAQIEGSEDPEELYFQFSEWCTSRGREPYAAQDEGFMELAADRNVLLCTPTGSGKSMVALFAHFLAFAKRQRSIYTAPTKALVNEKFFALCEDFGPRNVGLITGDGAVNDDALVICCTAEILSQMALIEGRETPFSVVVMDEFHYFGDRDRGMHWLLPLLEMPDARHLLMSATVGKPDDMRARVEALTGHDTALVLSKERPIPLKYDWRLTPVADSIVDAVEQGLTPVYVVYFSRKDASSEAGLLRGKLLGHPALSEGADARRSAIRERLRDQRLGSPFGKMLARLLPHGIAIHHSGMLPRYRRLVERLANDGLVHVVCGTDTLGVGVDMPVRTVVFTQLYKFDGRDSRILKAREFHQIAGRAGRREQGHVWVQPPEHIIVNKIEAAKAKAKKKKYRKRGEPRNFVRWDEARYERLRDSRPHALVAPFAMTPALVLGVLGRPGARVSDLHALVDRAQLDAVPRADAHAMVDTLVDLLQPLHLQRVETDGEEAWRIPGQDTIDRRRKLKSQRSLGPFLEHALHGLDELSKDFALDALSVVESVLDDPKPLLRAQAKAEGTRLWEEAKEEVAESLEARIEAQNRSREATWPRPLADYVMESFGSWSEANPWFTDPGPSVLEDGGPSPKSVVRLMFERGSSFAEMVTEFDLMPHEGLLLRYLSDALRVLEREIPPHLGDSAHALEGVVTLDELRVWLGVVVRSVDASIVHEWERFGATDDAAVPEAPPPPLDVTEHKAAFRRMVRSAAFGWVQAIAAEQLPPGAAMSQDELFAVLDTYEDEHGRDEGGRLDIDLGADARGPQYFWFDGEAGVRQTLRDPSDDRDWVVEGTVDLEASRDAGKAVLRLERFGRVDGA